MSEQESFDDFMDATATADAAVLPILPEGTHIGTIAWVGYQNKDFAKCDANPAGRCLTVKIVFPKHREVWESIPKHQLARIAALCVAARVDPPKRGELFDHMAMKDSTVSIQTVLGISRAGREFVKVEKFNPGAAPLPKEVRDAPPRKPAASKPAWEKDSEDIPF